VRAKYAFPADEKLIDKFRKGEGYFSIEEEN